MDLPPYRYQQLRSDHAFRVLEIEKAESHADATLRGKIHEAHLGKPPNYIALSYTWGLPIFSESIEIEGYRLPRTENLSLALRSVRCHLGLSGPVLVWADAICIHQADAEERAAQVRQMRRIYESAGLVWANLGLGHPESSLVAKVMELQRDAARKTGVLSYFTIEHNPDYITSKDHLAAFLVEAGEKLDTQEGGLLGPAVHVAIEDLFSRPWWIIQECTTHVETRICYGEALLW